jgi:hypothetical protein
LRNKEKIKRQLREYYLKHRDKILALQNAYNNGYRRPPLTETQIQERVNLSKKKLKQYKSKLHNRNMKLWEGYIPTVTNCEMCGKEIYFNTGLKEGAVHFDHRIPCSIKSTPTEWLRRHKNTPKNREIWEACNFGKLCCKLK